MRNRYNKMSNSSSKYNLAICEFFNCNMHGLNEFSSSNIEQHYLVNVIINDLNAEFYNFEYKNHIEFMTRSYQKRNEKIMFEFNLDIIEMIELLGKEQVAILKTCWLKIFQRKCKKYLSSLNKK